MPNIDTSERRLSLSLKEEVFKLVQEQEISLVSDERKKFNIYDVDTYKPEAKPFKGIANKPFIYKRNGAISAYFFGSIAAAGLIVLLIALASHRVKNPGSLLMVLAYLPVMIFYSRAALRFARRVRLEMDETGFVLEGQQIGWKEVESMFVVKHWDRLGIYVLVIALKDKRLLRMPYHMNALAFSHTGALCATLRYFRDQTYA